MHKTPGEHTRTAHTRSNLRETVSITPTWSSGGVARHTSAQHHNIIFGGDVIHDEGRREKHNSRISRAAEDVQQEYTGSKEREGREKDAERRCGEVVDVMLLFSRRGSSTGPLDASWSPTTNEILLLVLLVIIRESARELETE